MHFSGFCVMGNSDGISIIKGTECQVSIVYRDNLCADIVRILVI